jgi:HAMP domain-containing protein
LDIRTKLALVLVFVSLLSMGLIALFAYQTSAQLLQEVSIRQLDALAEGKAMDLVKVHQGWRDKTRLIRNGAELQQGLKNLIQTHDDTAHQELTKVLSFTALGIEGVERVTVVAIDGKEVCQVGRAQVYAEIELPDGERQIAYQGVHLSEEKGLLVTFTTPLMADGEVIGGIEIVFEANDMEQVASNYTGLGETGEVVVVTPGRNGGVLVLNRLRHSEALASPGAMPNAQISEPVKRVLAGESGVFIDEGLDYRGERVWAATRFLAEPGWGLVVKVDSSEETERADFLRDAMFDIALALSAFAIIGGTLLGFYLARPIHDLALLVQRIREGEGDLRANIKGDDEIAYLGESVNALVDYMQANEPTDQDGEQTVQQTVQQTPQQGSKTDW